MPKTAKTNEELEADFWAKVVKTDSCWIWTGGRDKQDYGRAYVGVVRGKKLAHRVAYEYLVGPIPENLTLDHLCRVHACVNPDHLEPVSLTENISRARLEVCRSGRHELSDENRNWDAQGRRRGCKLCREERRSSPEALEASRLAKERRRRAAGVTPAQKLTDEQVQEIVRLRAQGLTQAKIGEMFGVSREHVRDITKGKRRSTATLSNDADPL